jgi:putative transposase
VPQRKVQLVNGEIYHIFNRSVAKQPIFNSVNEYNTYLRILNYYTNNNPPLRYSYFSRLKQDVKTQIIENLYKQNNKLIQIFSFCLMPNHYHILAKQTAENGISNFIRLSQNSYARYLNTKTKRVGALFQSPFKALRIESDDQFIHVARYIHLNPLTSFILKDFEELKSYPWNSYTEYMSDNISDFINKTFLLSFYKNRQAFSKFTADNINYQRKLSKIKHLTIDYDK